MKIPNSVTNDTGSLQLLERQRLKIRVSLTIWHAKSVASTMRTDSRIWYYMVAFLIGSIVVLEGSAFVLPHNHCNRIGAGWPSSLSPQSCRCRRRRGGSSSLDYSHEPPEQRISQPKKPRSSSTSRPRTENETTTTTRSCSSSPAAD